MKLGDENRSKVRGESDSEERSVTTLAQAIYSGQFGTVMQTLVQNPDQLIMPEFTSDNKYRDYAFLYHYNYPFIALIKCILDQRNSKSKEYWNLFKFLVDTFPDTILKCFSGPNHLIVRIMYMSEANQTTLEGMITLLATIPGFSQVLNTLDSEGELALYVAMYNEKIAPSIVTLMMKHGANPLLLDKHERNAFHFIAGRDEVFQTNIFPVLYQLFNQSTNINQLSRAGGTPLHTLLRKNIYVVWCSLKTHCSFTKAKLESGIIPCDHDLVKKLLEMGADPNILYRGVTVLHIACMAGDSGLVKLLMSFKADVNMLSSLGLTAIDYLPDTTDKNKLRVQETRELLISAGAKELEETDEFPDDRRLDAAVKLISHEKAKGRFCYLSEQAQRKFKEASQGIKSTFEERTIKTFNIQPDKCTEVVKHHQVDHFVLTELFDEKEARVTVMKDIVPEKKRNLHVLKRPLSSFIHRKRIGWEFLQREMRPESLDRYLSQFNTVQLTIAGDTPLDFVDLREVDDYSFVVNTVMSWPGRLSELLKGDPKFFTETPYISCCLLNKATRGFSGGHHTNLLFPIYMALEVKPGAIQYMGPTDIGSPYACPPESKFQYLNYVSKAREEMDILEALHQCDLMERTENKMGNRFPPSPFFAEASVRCHTAYRTSGYKDSGSTPFFTIEGLNRTTCKPTLKEASYSELIVETNAMAQDNIRGRLLLVEQHFIDEFNERYPRLIDKNKIEARASLEMLKRVCAESGGRWRLAVIKTDVNAYQLKLPVVQQIENLKNEKSILVQTVKRLRRGIRRLEQAGLPHPCPNDVAEEEQKLAALLQRQNYLEKLSAKDSDYEEFMARGCK